MSNDTFSAWLTKDLRADIRQVLARNHTAPGSINPLDANGNPTDTYAFGEDVNWHRTRESAVHWTTKRRDDTVADLQRQIAYYQTMDFSDN